MAFLKTLIDGNEREVARLRRTAKAVNEFDDASSPRSRDADLQAKTAEFKGRLEQGESLDAMLPGDLRRRARGRQRAPSACVTSTCRSWAGRCSTKGASPR